MKLTDFDIKDFDFSDTEKYDDFDRYFRFVVVLGISTEDDYQKFKRDYYAFGLHETGSVRILGNKF